MTNAPALSETPQLLCDLGGITISDAAFTALDT